MKQIARITALGMALCMFGACAGTPTYKKADITDAKSQAVLSAKPAPLQPAYQKLLEEGDRNSVLNLMRIGANAFQLGYKTHAKNAFDGALDGIERVYADNKTAAQARSMWHEEGKKNFKGEPYERVMAYYYRGLLYIIDKDYQNARACFKGGMLQDAFAEEDQHRCDFALMLYLSGWCSQNLADEVLTRPTFEELKKLRPDALLPKDGDNVLLVVETGYSPRKLSDGVGHYQLKFRRGRNFVEKKVGFRVDGGQAMAAYPLEDIFWQAQTRGGRLVDSILLGKAQFKKKTQTAGNVLGSVGSDAMMAASFMGDAAGDIQGIAAGIGLIGVAAQLTAQRARTEADIRYWDNLPDMVHVASLKLSPGTHEIAVDFLDVNGVTLPELGKVISVDIPSTGNRLVWVKSRQQISQ